MNQERLFAQLTDADEEVRATAREELHLIMDDAVAQGFLDIIQKGEASEDVIADTIVGLGPVIEEAGIDFDVAELDLPDAFEFGPPVSRETFDTILRELRAVYDDASRPQLIRRRAFEVLVRDPQDWQVEEIRKHFASDDPKWQLTAVFGMGNVRGFEKEIVELVNKGNDDLLFEAVRAAGGWEVTATAERIRAIATHHDDLDMRLVAIEALPNVDPDCAELLQDLLEDDDDEIAEAARDALDELEGLDEDDME